MLGYITEHRYSPLLAPADHFGAVPTAIPGSLWENGFCERFKACLRDEFLNGQVFHSLNEAQILIADRRTHDRTKRPHSALAYLPPGSEVIVPSDPGSVMHQQSNWTTKVGLISGGLAQCQVSPETPSL